VMVGPSVAPRARRSISRGGSTAAEPEEGSVVLTAPYARTGEHTNALKADVLEQLAEKFRGRRTAAG